VIRYGGPQLKETKDTKHTHTTATWTQTAAHTTTVAEQAAAAAAADDDSAVGWLCSPAVEHRSLAGVLSLSCARLAADG